MSGAASYKSRSVKSSRYSLKSGSSRYSTLNKQLIKARAEAETTKVQAIFAQKEAEMKAESASKEAEIEALQKECEHVEAMARLKVFEQALPTTINIPVSANTSPELQDTDPPTAFSLPDCPHYYTVREHSS
ncbi:uncharacterized protein ACNLHF_025629 [Anomaloglossus baeobatrachus]